jgi:hypothetical protein
MSQSADTHAAGTAGGDTEEIDALPVLAGASTVVHPYPLPAAPPTHWRATGAALPAVQAVAVAAGGFVAGVAVVGLVHRRGRHSAAGSQARRIGRGAARGSRGKRGVSKAGELVQIVSSRSLLVDVHLLAGRD